MSTDDHGTKAIPPLLIIKRGSASRDDIKLLRSCGIAVVPVKDPADVRFMQAPLEPLARLPAIAVRLVREINSASGTYVDRDKIRARLLDAFLSDEQPPTAKEISP